MITAEAARAARGLLGWTLEELAAASGVAFSTLSRFENGRAIRRGTSDKLITVLAENGVDLVINEHRTGAILVYDRRGGGR